MPRTRLIALTQLLQLFQVGPFRMHGHVSPIKEITFST